MADNPSRVASRASVSPLEGAVQAQENASQSSEPQIRVLASAPPRPAGRSGAARCGTLLLGTAQTVRQLAAGLRETVPAPHVVGCVLMQPAATDLPLWGTVDQLNELCRRPGIERVVISLPAVMAPAARRAAQTLDAAGVAWSNVKTLADQMEERAAPRGGPGFDLSQLLDRQPEPLDDVAIAAVLRGRRVLITGAGGSIGSELALRVAGYGPSELTLVERSENALFEIDRRIAHRFPKVVRHTVMHDITHHDRTARLLGRVRPEVVFHAAAHKHVPMMEDHPALAVENNFHGTRSVADAAAAAGAERFVMISTDKAVNPSSVMGATKRMAERYIQHLDHISDTTFCMVRFGNVLGSACSLIPIWTEQLAQGGPLTVTHRDMTRYFMTIPEAAGLVLQAGATARGAEVFLLDMGEPVRIVDMADRFLKAQGLVPGVDVGIAFTGPRPGEKLFEELAYRGEDMAPTAHPSIRRWRTGPPQVASVRQMVRTFDRLRAADDGVDPPAAAVVAALHTAVPEMVAACA